MSSPATVRILDNEPIGTISPRLYGQFAEHLGRCCYDGLWVRPTSDHTPHLDGFRTDVVEALRAMPTPLLRWPGGCYADHYHWRDGIGPANERPVRLGLSCGLQVEDDNSLGTHEFLQFCSLIGAEPYLAGNMGSGSVQEMCDWVEYCNKTVKTSLASERARNGHPETYGVKLWGVGNENWGCGGCYDAHSYGLEYRRYASMIKHVEPSAELVVCGHTFEWNQALVQTLSRHLDLIDHFSVHQYWIRGGPGIAFSESEYYGLLSEAEVVGDFIQQTADLLRDFDKQGRIGVALDEWGVWHPEARPWGPGGEGDLSGEYLQAATMRDAVAAAVALEAFHRKCNVLSLANLAQVVNVLHAPVMTEGPHMWLTPTYYVFQLHKPHVGATAVRTVVEAADPMPDGRASVSATASKTGNRQALTLINRHMRSTAAVKVPEWATSFNLLSSASASAENSLSDRHRVGIRELHAKSGVVELPPHSVATAAV